MRGGAGPETAERFLPVESVRHAEGSIPTDLYRGRYTVPADIEGTLGAPVLGGLIFGHTEEFRDGMPVFPVDILNETSRIKVTLLG